MTCTIENPAGYDLTDLETHVHDMYDFFNQKYSFKDDPKVIFDSEPTNGPIVLGKTAYYDPQTLEVHIFVDDRHPKDMLRSIAHELIHHMQNLEGRLDVGGYMDTGYYLKNEKMKKLEQEAMLHGNATMREYEDRIKLKEKDGMSLNEWKNNELNRGMLKKFGLLKEAAFDGGQSVGEAQIDTLKEEEELEDTEGSSDGREEFLASKEDEFSKKEEMYNSLKESIKRIAKSKSVILKSVNKRIK